MQTIDKVINGGYCIGCGICAGLRPMDFELFSTEHGMYQAKAIAEVADRKGDVSFSCPMSGLGVNEDQISERLFPEADLHDKVGRHIYNGMGWASEGIYRDKGTSGGLITWVATCLLEEGFVDEVLHVGASTEGEDALFQYKASRTKDDVLAGAKSRYYPIQVGDILKYVQSTEKKFAFIGLPCMVKGVQALRLVDEVFNERIVFCVSLFCGHLKSAHYAELLAWQKGITPQELGYIDFRVKIENTPANDYGFSALSKNGKKVFTAMREVEGGNWGHGMMKYPACDYCDDVVGECADLSVGDAWLDGVKEDWRGTSIFVVRSQLIDSIIKRGKNEDRLHITEISPDRVAESQASGFEHRRIGLAWRIYQLDQSAIWHPEKRMGPSAKMSKRRKKITEMRQKMTTRSHKAFTKARKLDDIGIFFAEMKPLVDEYRELYRVSIYARIVRKFRRILGTGKL